MAQYVDKSDRSESCTMLGGGDGGGDDDYDGDDDGGDDNDGDESD